jgi:hypothetical protein
LETRLGGGFSDRYFSVPTLAEEHERIERRGSRLPTNRRGFGARGIARAV